MLKTFIEYIKYNNNKYYLQLIQNDTISQHINNSHNFFEEDCLKKIDNIVRINNDSETILDIGGFIGNHSIFFSQIMNCKNVIAFEPNELVFPILINNALKYNFKAYQEVIGDGRKVLQNFEWLNHFYFINSKNLINFGQNNYSIIDN